MFGGCQLGRSVLVLALLAAAAFPPAASTQDTGPLPFPPAINQVTPGSGPSDGGTTVSILGLGLYDATGVMFGSTPAVRFAVLNEFQVEAVSPAHAEGTVHVRVVTPRGTTPTADCGDSLDTASLAPRRPDCDRFHFYDEPSGGRFAGAGTAPGGAEGRLAVTLADAKVLVAGGCVRNGASCLPTSRTDLFDPATGAWSSCSEATAARGCPGPTRRAGYGTLTLLADGRVLAVGGEVERAAELYDPLTGRWTDTASMGSSRSQPTVTRLGDGRVLVLGGDAASSLRSAEVFDPADGGSWSAAPPPVDTVGSGWTATLLRSGDVLSSGGRPAFPSPDNTQKAELFRPRTRPDTGFWTPTGPPSRRRFGHTATLLEDGTVLVTGGSFADGAVTFSASELYDPASGLWRETGRLGEPRSYHHAPILPGGRVLVVGGHGRYGQTTVAETYDPAAGRWRYAAFVPEGLHDVRAVAVLPPGPRADCAGNCGKVLVGGRAGESFELFVPVWTLFTPTPLTRSLGPSTGPASGGTTVTITGDGLASVSSVRFGVLEARRITPDPATPDTRLTAVAPAHAAGPVKVTLTTDGGTSGAGTFAYLPDPGGPAAGGDGQPVGPTSRGRRARAHAARCRSAAANLLTGTSRADSIVGTAAPDRVRAGPGADRVDARAGMDCVVLGPGADRGRGGPGADAISGGPGGDRITGGPGRDRITGGPGRDRIRTRGGGPDRVGCGRGRDTVIADRLDRIARDCERILRR